MKVRVFEIAKQAGKSAQEVLDELKKRGVEVKGTLSQVEDGVAAQLLEQFAHGGKAVAAAEKPKPAPRRIILPAEKPSKPMQAQPKPVEPQPEPEPEVEAKEAEAPAPVKQEHPAPVEEAKPAAPMTPLTPGYRPPAPAPKPAPAPVAKPAEAPAPAPAPAAAKPAAPMTPLTPGYRPPAPAPKPPVPMTPLTPGYRPPAKPIGPLTPGYKPGSVTAAAAKAAAAPAAVGISSRPASAAPAPKTMGGPRHSRGPVSRKDKEGTLKQHPKHAQPKPAPAPAPVVEEVPERKVVKLPESVTVSELAERMNIKAAEIIKKLMMDYKVLVTMNQRLSNDQAQTVALDFGYETEMVGLYGEDLLSQEQDDPKRMVPRSPVVTIMGHVDHGKTSLLDAIRKTEVAAGESGGITQHIGAYKVRLGTKGEVVFLDTPGHKAFTQMRARGAAVTDVVVLVVAADDGVQPQTLEAIDHAKAAGVPVVVAINKIDKPEANPDRVMQELSKHNLVPEEWGGKTIFTQVSAKKRLNLEKLLELLLLEAELLELKADPARHGKGAVIEAKLDKGRGPVATVLVQTGTVRVGDLFVAGSQMGRVRALINDHGKKIDAAGPSTPVEVLGFAGVPDAGDGFQVVENERVARQISQHRMEAQKERERSARSHVKLDGLFDQISQGDLKELKVIIKSDVAGSSEAIKDELERLPSDKVKVRVIHAGVGAISESDVDLADASDALVFGFRVKAENKGTELAKEKEVEVRIYDVIYDLVNDVRNAMEGLLEAKQQEVSLGKGEVRGVFKITGGVVAGTYVTSGKVQRNAQARLVRGGEEVWKGKLDGLKRFKDDVKEVSNGMECGVSLAGYSDVQVGDQLEFFVIESVAQKL